MKKTLFLVMALFGISLLYNVTQTYGMEMSAEQKMLWEKTQKGWEKWKKGDIEGFKAGIHEDYTCWPSSRAFPENKDAYTNRLFRIHLSSYKLDPVKVSISGNLALVMYYWTCTSQYGQLSGRTTKIYMKQDGKWHLMGQMNASCEKPAICPN